MKTHDDIIELIVSEEFNDVRLDHFLPAKMEFTRSFIQKLIKSGNITLNGNVVDKNKIPVHFNDIITISVPKPTDIEIKPEKMDLNILFEDEHVIVIDKPKNMVVHPAPGHYEHTLVNGLLYHCKSNLSGINGVLRPGIVHRIDKDTTGAIIACKTDIAHQSLSEQLSTHSITRKYNAIVLNNFSNDDGIIDFPIGRNPSNRKTMAVVSNNTGKKAVTHYRVLDHLNNQYNHIECILETGRTHQIRVHMSYIKHPLLGDEVYGTKSKKEFQSLQGQCLHARILGFMHPTSKQYIEVESPLPQYFVKLLERLKK